MKVKKKYEKPCAYVCITSKHVYNGKKVSSHNCCELCDWQELCHGENCHQVIILNVIYVFALYYYWHSLLAMVSTLCLLWNKTKDEKCHSYHIKTMGIT